MHLNNIFFYERANIVDDWTESEWLAAYERTYTPGSKTAVFYHQSLFNIIRVKLNRIEPPKLLKMRYMLEPRCFLFNSHTFLFEAFDRKLQQYIEGDLVAFNDKHYIEFSNPKKFEVYKEPFAVLTLKELEAGFVVCTIPLTFSILIFAIEWMSTLKNLVVFLFIFKKYFDLKKLEQSRHSELMKIKFSDWQAPSSKACALMRSTSV